MNLIPEIKQAWRLTSVQAAAILAVLSMLQLQVLPVVQPLVPSAWWPWVTFFFAVAIVICRLIAQPAVTADTAAALDPLTSPDQDQSK